MKKVENICCTPDRKVTVPNFSWGCELHHMPAEAHD
jgi:hypothetical protein